MVRLDTGVRLMSPTPPAPVEVPLTPVRAEHVAAHDVGTGHGDHLGLVPVFPMVELPGVQAVGVEVAERTLGALPPPRPVAVEGDLMSAVTLGISSSVTGCNAPG